MGYEMQLQFVDLELRGDCISKFIKAADAISNRDKAKFARLLYCVKIDTEEGYLDWHLDDKQRRMMKTHTSQPVLKPTTENLRHIKSAVLECWIRDEKDPVGKWPEAEAFVRWLVNYCRSGEVYMISQEGDGAIWGWQFGPKGLRELAMVPVTRWWAPRKRGRTSR